jgi:hypothetical protein
VNDMSSVIVPKSDQINAEDFLAGPRTFTIEGVSISPGTEQPVQIKLAGEDRVWRPCKSMSRVLVSAWGPDANVYRGRAITLYRDPKVKWGGMEIGGIRVSHMSHIEREMLLQLTATKGKRAPHIVKVLEAPALDDPARKWADGFIANINKVPVADALEPLVLRSEKRLVELSQKRPELHAECQHAIDLKRQAFGLTSNDGTLSDDNATAAEGPADDDRGEPFAEQE